MAMDNTLIEISDLKVSFAADERRVDILAGVSLRLERGRTLCLVGESGCGKSVTAKAILRVLDKGATIDGGAIRYTSEAGAALDLAAIDPRSERMRALRGDEIAMIYQEPMTALSPLYTIGNQIVEALRWHRKLGEAEARQEALRVLDHVGMPAPAERFHAYSFELSGGQRQRAMIAMALICRPRLLIADEPTTSLDVTTQANILDLLRRLQAETGMAVLFITHDLGVVEEIGDDVAVMYLGKIVEQGTVREVFADPRHPYTRGLLASMPRLDGDYRAPLQAIPGTVPAPAQRPHGCGFHPRCVRALAGVCDGVAPPAIGVGSHHVVACHAYGAEADRLPPWPVAKVARAPSRLPPADAAAPLLEVRGLSKHYPIRRGFFARTVDHVRAVTDVSLTIRAGETLGLVGESGCGKSTLGQTLVGLTDASAGSALYRGADGVSVDLFDAKGAARRRLRNDIRMVFQDPTGSLNPRLRVRDIVGEVLEVGSAMTRAEIDDRVADLLRQVGLPAEYADRHPHAFSGGQRQRIAIARALASNPRLVIADEAVSALDVSVQTQIINLMKALQASHGLTYLFVSHDLGVIANISDRVAVMYAGRIVETGPTDALFRRPRHPYTEALLAAIPGRGRHDRRATRSDGHAPARGSVLDHCAFASRCRYAVARCHATLPSLAALDADPNGHAVACLRASELELVAPLSAPMADMAEVV